jgi:tetratricopeptide (TPR) repeat protein
MSIHVARGAKIKMVSVESTLRPPRAIVAGALTMLVILSGILFDAALVNLVAVRNLLPSLPNTAPIEQATRTRWGACRVAHLLGREQLLQGHYHEAITVFQQRIGCAPDKRALFDLGWAQYRAGLLPDAAISWHQADAYAYADQLARQVDPAQDREAALQAWEFAAAVGPEQPRPYLVMAKLVLTSDPGQAEQFLLRALELAPDNIAAYQSLGDFYLRHAQDPQQAANYYQQALTRDPNNPQLLGLLAQATAKLGDTSQAIAYWQQAAALLSGRDLAPVYRNLGDLALTQGDGASAMTYYHQALAVAPKDPEFLTIVARGIAEAGCLAEAVTLYEQALAQGAKAKVRETAETQLTKLQERITTQATQQPAYCRS